MTWKTSLLILFATVMVAFVPLSAYATVEDGNLKKITSDGQYEIGMTWQPAGPIEPGIDYLFNFEVREGMTQKSIDDASFNFDIVKDGIVTDSTSTNSGSITQTYGNSVLHAVALNMDDGEITYYANGSVVSGLNQVDLDGLDGETVAPFASVYNQQLLWNFGGYTTITISSAATDENGYGTFEYAPPSGYYALCSKNLAEFG